MTRTTRPRPLASTLAVILLAGLATGSAADPIAWPTGDRDRTGHQRGPDRSDAAPASGAVVADHVRDVAARVAPHLPRLGAPPPVAVVERAALTAGVVADGRSRELEVSTGVLGALRSDAQLAMVVAYELARVMPNDAPRTTVRRRSLGERVARAAAVGAAAGAASGLVYDELRGSDRIVRHAGSAAAAAAAGTATAAAFDRRGTKARTHADDEAAEDALRAVVAAGYDGREALSAWDALTLAAPLGGPEGGLADRKANAKRQKKGRRVLDGSRVTADSGHLVGGDGYRRDVLRHLDAWRFAEAVPPSASSGRPATEDPRATPPPSRPTWLTYERSGGITGWTARVDVAADGSVRVSRHERGQRVDEATSLSPSELRALEAAVADVVALPPRAVRPGARTLRDGQQRLVTVRTGDGERRLVLSDGHELLPPDWRLVNLLEDLTRPTPPAN